MSAVEWVLLALWAVLASACILNWRAQRIWNRAFLESVEGCKDKVWRIHAEGK